MTLTTHVFRPLFKHHGREQSIQRTANVIGLSASIVKKYFHRISATWDEAKFQTQEELMAALQPTRRTISSYFAPDYDLLQISVRRIR